MENNFDGIDEVLLRRMATQKWAGAEKGVISLTTADADFPVAGEIKEAIKKGVDEERTFYGGVAGDSDVLQVICGKLRERNKLDVDTEDVYIVPGTMFGVFLGCWYALRARSEEAIITPSPVHGPFYANVKNVGGRVVYNDIREPDFALDLADLKRRITKRTRLLMVCNPHNPTGRVFTRNELEGIAGLAKKHNLTILCDELYEDLIYEGEHISLASISRDAAERTLTVFGFSKAYNIAGLRVAYIVNQGGIMKELRARLPAMIVHTDRLAQLAARAALTEGGAWLEAFKSHLSRMRDYCMERVGALPGIKCFPPQAGPLLFLNIKPFNMRSSEMAERLKKKARVLVIPGTHFGPAGEGYIRINFATSRAVLKEAFDRIEAALKLWQAPGATNRPRPLYGTEKGRAAYNP